MARQAIIVLGAGASYDCASNEVRQEPNSRPPLVGELFDSRFAETLREYPLAQQIVPNIRTAVRSGSVAIEKYLREELRDSPFPHLRRRYRAIPLYLQHMLWDVSRGYTDHPDNYDRLITEALRLDRVTFVTLNYDTILDNRLAIDAPLRTINDYIGSQRKWSLVKLHGSVNWGQIVRNKLVNAPNILIPNRRMKTYAEDFAALGEDFELDDQIVLREGSLESIRAKKVKVRPQRFGQELAPQAQLFYPTVAAPLGSEDEIVCPKEHFEHAREHMRNAADGLNLLVIGYSGLDRKVLELLSQSGQTIRSLKVVNGTVADSFKTATIICEKMKLGPTEDMAFERGFNEFARDGALSEFFRTIGED